MHAPCSKRAARGRAGQYARPQALATVYMYVSPLSRLVCVCVRMYRAGQYARPQALATVYMCPHSQDLYAYAYAYASACIGQGSMLARRHSLPHIYMCLHSQDLYAYASACIGQGSKLALRHACMRVLAYYCVL
jgi:hypothetical protein